MQTAHETERDELWRSSRDLLVMISREGRVLEVNPAWTRILGWTEQELLGTKVKEHVRPDDLERARERFAEVVSGDSVEELCVHFQASDSRYHVVEWTAGLSGEVVFASGRDITERVEREGELRVAEAGLRQAQKLETLGQLTGGVAHDFNNLLMSVGANLELLLHRVPSTDEESVSLVDGALASVERGARLTQRMLAFARKQELKPTPVDVAALLVDMGESLDRTVGAKVQLTVSAHPDVPLALVDPVQLELAILNLTRNACDATIGTGKVEVLVDQTDRDIDGAGFVRLRVRDDGAGMDEETLSKAVEPFFTTKAVGSGTGLGLPMVHGLAAQTGGNFSLSSEPGQGTTAEILVPLASGVDHTQLHQTVPSAKENAADGNTCDVGLDARNKTGEPGSAEKLRVLVVDDDESVLTGIVKILRARGHHAAPASSAAIALGLLDADENFDAIVTDHAMPEMNGSQLASLIKARLPLIPIILATGYAESCDDSAHQIDVRLMKPFRAKQLIDALRACTSPRAAQQRR